MNLINKAYGTALRITFTVLNPLKKKVIKTQCEVHKYLNNQAINILLNEKKYDEYEYYKYFIQDINRGAVWADQDFRSSNHFYNPYTEKGLYGRNNCKDLALSYYDKSLRFIHKGNVPQGMFYLGATLHLLQDMTIPQHANIRLLDDHRQYEQYIIRTYRYVKEYQADKGAYPLKSLENYMKFNGRVAMKVYNHYKTIKNDEKRFKKIACCTLPLAERTSAGFMLLFYQKAIQ
ncbi:MAG: zinc dependent phospholipase C family protein [Eubacteriales bacterium]